MLQEQPLVEAVEAVARQLVEIEHGPRRSIIRTPLLYPSGSTVALRIINGANGGGGYTVSDMALGFDEAEALGAGRLFSKHAPIIAEESGVQFEGKSFVLRGVGSDRLVGVAIAVANSSLNATLLASHRQAARDARQTEAQLLARLQRIFGAVEHMPIYGASGTEWDVDAVVRIGDRLALFDAVSPARQSIYATVAKFHDIARLEHAPTRFAAVSNRADLGSMLGVLSQAATVIEDATPDQTIVQFARAA